MKTLLATAALLIAAVPALAADYEPSPNGTTFRDFVEARGCVLVQQPGRNYSTFVGGCPAAASFIASSGGANLDTDNDTSTPDEWVSNN